jgi:DNA-binding CsgD family transcriptional regulator
MRYPGGCKLNNQFLKWNDQMNFISLAEDAAFIGRVLSHVPGFISFQDLNAKFLCANELMVKALGFNHLNELLGLYPRDIRCPAAELEDEVKANMQYVIEQDAPIVTLFSAYTATNKWGLYIGQQQPLRDRNHATIGVATHTFEISNTPIPNHLLHLFLEKGKKCPKFRQGVYKYLDCCKQWNLSPRQGECLFWILQRKSAREIAALLGLSKRTIEHYFDLIKSKFEVKSLNELMELARDTSLLNFIPQHWCMYTQNN